MNTIGDFIHTQIPIYFFPFSLIAFPFSFSVLINQKKFENVTK